MKTIAIILSFGLLVPSVNAVSRNWTGGGGTNTWSTPANWNPTGTPSNGDELHVFAANATTRNDLSNLKLDNLVIGASTLIVGNALVLSNGIECGSGVTSEVAVDITLGASQTFKAFHPSSGALLITGNIDLAGHFLVLETDTSSAVINLGGSTSANVTGTGNIYVWNTTGNAATGGEVQFSGTVGNGIDGFIEVYPNTRLRLKKTSGHPVNRLLKIDANSIVHCQFAPQFDLGSRVVIESGGQLLGGGESHEFATLEVQNSAMADSEGGLFTLRTNLIAQATNGAPIIKGNLSFANQISIDVSGSYSLDILANITGGNGFDKVGAGTLLLRGTNTFNGSVGVNEGKVAARSATAFGSTSGGTVLNGADVYILLFDAAIGNEPLAVNGGNPTLFGYTNSSWAGPITLNTNLETSTGATSNHLTLSGVISGTGGLMIGSGIVQLSGSSGNTYTGTTWVRGAPDQAATLELNKSIGDAVIGPLVIGDTNDIGGTAAKLVRLLTGTVMGNIPVTIGGSSLLDLNGNSDGVASLSLYGGGVTTGAGTLTLAGDVDAHYGGSTLDSYHNTISGKLDLGGALRTFTVAGIVTDPDLRITAVISGNNGGIIKAGGGTLTLTAANSYHDATVINDGVLVVNNNGALGNSSTGTTVNSGGTLRLGTNVTSFSEPLTLNGAGFGGTNGALHIATLGTNTVVGSYITLGSASTIRVESNSIASITGVIDGTGSLTKTGNGTLTFGGINFNTYFGDTFVYGGELRLAKSNGAAAIPSHLVIGSGSLGPSATVRHVAGASNNIIGSITVNGDGLYDLNGQVEGFTLPELGGQPPLRLNDGGDVQTGTGILYLPAGTSVIVEPGINGTSTISGRLGLEASLALGQIHYFAVNSPISSFAGVPLTVTAALEAASSTAAHVVKTGPGEMRLSGNNTYAGQLAVTAGQVTLASAAATGASGSSVLVSSNAVLAIDGSFTFNNEPLTLNSSNPVPFVVLSGSSIWNSTIALSQNTTLNVAAGAALEAANSISGSGALTKIGAGQLYMTASVANTYTNTTWVKEGDLLLSSTAINGTIVGPLIIGDGAGGANADKVYVSRVRQIANTVPVTINSSGLLDIVAGKSDAFGALSGSGNILFEGSNDLEVGLDDGSSMFSGLISGGGNFWKHGTGTMTLSGNNTYTGLTIVEGAGTLLVNGSQPASNVILTNGATLGGSGTVGAITVVAGATVSPGNSPGMLTCSSVTFNSGSVFRTELNGTNSGTGYDVLASLGSVSLGNATLNASLGFSSSASNSFTILSRGDASPITGTFSGLPQGASLIISGAPFTISYTGGVGGNDVVLTRISVPASPISSVTGITNGAFQIAGTGLAGVNYGLEASTNLTLWQLIANSTADGAGHYMFSDIFAPMYTNRFYRVVSP